MNEAITPSRVDWDAARKVVAYYWPETTKAEDEKRPGMTKAIAHAVARARVETDTGRDFADKRGASWKAGQKHGQLEVLDAVVGAQRQDLLELLIETMLLSVKGGHLPVMPEPAEKQS